MIETHFIYAIYIYIQSHIIHTHIYIHTHISPISDPPIFGCLSCASSPGTSASGLWQFGRCQSGALRTRCNKPPIFWWFAAAVSGKIGVYYCFTNVMSGKQGFLEPNLVLSDLVVLFRGPSWKVQNRLGAVSLGWHQYGKPSSNQF